LRTCFESNFLPANSQRRESRPVIEKIDGIGLARAATSNFHLSLALAFLSVIWMSVKSKLGRVPACEPLTEIESLQTLVAGSSSVFVSAGLD